MKRLFVKRNSKYFCTRVDTVQKLKAFVLTSQNSNGKSLGQDKYGRPAQSTQRLMSKRQHRRDQFPILDSFQLSYLMLLNEPKYDCAQHSSHLQTKKQDNLSSSDTRVWREAEVNQRVGVLCCLGYASVHFNSDYA